MIKTIQFGSLLVALVWTTTVLGTELDAQIDGAIDDINIETGVFIPVLGGVIWQKEIEKVGTQYIRLHVVTAGVPDSTDLRLTLRDRDGRQVRMYEADELKRRRAFWTTIVPGDYALLTLTASEMPADFKLTIDQIAFQAFGGAPLSTWGKDEKEPLVNYRSSDIIYKAGPPVAKLLFVRAGAPRICTGFLIAGNRLMTNEHCVNDQATCESAIAIFGYEHRREGDRTVLDYGKEFECEQVASGSMNVALDYAVLDMRGDPGKRFGMLELATSDPSTTQELFIIQHPAGNPKQISKVNCSPLALPVEGRGPDSDFSHTCDTAGGSSGSPVLDGSGRVVGLHHYGFGEGLSGGWKENRAVRITKILANMQH